MRGPAQIEKDGFLMPIPYIHNKTGRRYIMLAHGVDCTNMPGRHPVVIYCPDDQQNTIFVRELSEFEAEFSPDLGDDADAESQKKGADDGR